MTSKCTYAVKVNGRIVAKTHSRSRADRLRGELGGKILTMPAER